MEKELVLRFTDPTEGLACADNVLSETMKLRQLCGGWCYDDDRTVRRVGNSKEQALAEVLEEIGDQAIIWVEFREDAESIRMMLGPSCCMLIGGISNTDRQDAISGFQQGKYKYLVAHPQSAGHGLTFVNSRYAVFYSLGYSLEYHQQARDRIHRIGQKNKCTYIYLLANGTIEEKIFSIVREKADAVETIKSYLSGLASAWG